MDAWGFERAHLVGNSMGGRIALEVALADPDRAITVSLLAPALAFRKRRELVPLVKLRAARARRHPAPHARPRASAPTSGACSPDPERLDPAAADVAIEEFCRTYRSRSARIAFFAALRNIYLDAPHGEQRAVDPASPRCSLRPSSSGATAIGSSRPASPATSARGRPVGPPGDPAGVRPRAAGGARPTAPTR